MQKTVKDEHANFGLERAAIFPSIAAGNSGSDGDVAEKILFVDAPRGLRRKRQNVGRVVFAAIGFIEAGDFGIGDKCDGDAARIQFQGTQAFCREFIERRNCEADAFLLVKYSHFRCAFQITTRGGNGQTGVTSGGAPRVKI